MRLTVYYEVDSGPDKTQQKRKDYQEINRASLPDPTDVVEGGL